MRRYPWSTTSRTGRSRRSPSTPTSWDIERANNLFINEPRPLLGTAEADDVARAQLDAGMGLSTLIHMDDPNIGWYARLAPTGFVPRRCGR